MSVELIDKDIPPSACNVLITMVLSLHNPKCPEVEVALLHTVDSGDVFVNVLGLVPLHDIPLEHELEITPVFVNVWEVVPVILIPVPLLKSVLNVDRKVKVVGGKMIVYVNEPFQKNPKTEELK